MTAPELLGYDISLQLAQQQLPDPAPTTPAADVHDHEPHVTGTWPHWWVECRVDGWHAHWLTFDPVHGVRDTPHVEPTEDRAWVWLEHAEQVIG